MVGGGVLRGYTLASALALAIGWATANADIVTSIPTNGTLTSTWSWSSTASGQSPTTITGDGMNDGLGPVTVEDLSANGASTYTFGNTFVAPSGSYPASNEINGQSYGFVDTYVIDVPNALASAYVFSLSLGSSLGLENLTARLYDYNANGVQNLTIGGTGPVSGIIDSWSTSSSSGGIASTQLPITSLSMGEYVLQIAGLETGTSSGTYSGQLDVTPVPLPASLPLLLSGVGALGFALRRRRLAA